MHKNCFNCVLYILISQPQFCCWPGLCWRWSFSLWSFCCQLGDVRFVTCSTYGPHRQAECLWMAGSTVRRKGERIMLHHVGQCWTSNDQCSDVFPVWRRMQKFHANGYIYFFVLDARMRKLPYSFLCCQNEFHLSVVSFLRVGARGDVLIYQAAPRDASMLLGMRRRLQDWGAIANMYETLRNYFPDLRLHLSGPHQIAPNSTKLSSERNWKQPPPSITDVFDIGLLLGVSGPRSMGLEIEIHGRRMSSPADWPEKLVSLQKMWRSQFPMFPSHVHHVNVRWFVSKAEGCPFVILVCMLYSYIH